MLAMGQQVVQRPLPDVSVRCATIPAMKSYRPPFSEIIPAAFLERPNRFIVIGRLADGTTVRAFLPNPGRLQELLLPQVTIYLVPAADGPSRKTAFTMVGVEGPRHPIFLHTHVNNDVARHLIASGRVPGLEGARIVRSEVPLEHSRFDFLLEHEGAPLYLEVKSCTLFGNRVAMFPDAITERGRRHLEELAVLARSGVRTAVMFVVHSGEVRWFMPDYHTDLAFSRTLLAVRDVVTILPVAISWRDDFRLGSTARLLPIPWDFLAEEVGDRGNYLILSRAEQAESGTFRLRTGWMAEGLFAGLRRVAKCLPVDEDRLEVYALAGSRDRSPALATRLDDWASAVAPGLWERRGDPRHDEAFHRLLADFRMVPPTRPKLGR